MRRKANAVYIELVPKAEGTYWGGDVELNIICDPNSTLDNSLLSSYHGSRAKCGNKNGAVFSYFC
jgi:hypothetical protein